MTFHDPDQIVGRQLYRHASDWIAGKAEGPLVLLDHDAMEGQPHAWTDTIQISVHFPIAEEEIEESRLRREEGATSLEPVFRRWQQEADRHFEDWYREELEGWPQFVWADFLRSTGRLLAGLKGMRQLDTEDLLPRTRSRELVFVLAETLKNSGVPDEEAIDRVHELLFSGTLDRVPRLRISSLLWAAMAHQAGHGGRQQRPNRGMMTDVGVVSSVLPYCDAVLVDNEVRVLLELGPVRERLGFDMRVFSMRTIGDLLDYLDEVERQAPGHMIETAVGLYGEPKAYLSIFGADP